MQAFAHWTNVSETTFVVSPTTAEADYKVRIFTPAEELAFAGHPTLGTCHAWLEAGGTPNDANVVVQECGVGLVPVKRDGERLAFARRPASRPGLSIPARSTRSHRGCESRRRTSSTPSGSTTDRVGSQSCCRASTQC